LFLHRYYAHVATRSIKAFASSRQYSLTGKNTRGALSGSTVD
jgi:hypothetical protein